VNPGDGGADSQVNLLGRKAPRSSISHEQDTTVHEFDPDETIPYQEDFSKASNWAPSYSQLEIRSLQLEDHDLQPMIDWLKSKQTPTDSVLRLHGPATRPYGSVATVWYLEKGFYTISGLKGRTRIFVW